MLSPEDRSHIFQLLRPPAGCQLTYAIGTTFSLDLYALLTLPVAFASMDWETPTGEPISNPIVLLEAIRRHSESMTIFCQAGRTVRPGRHQPLFALLEDSIKEVHLEDFPGVFHPKVWVLRFRDGDEILYRLLCLSRNLTFDRSWDTVVCLEGHVADRQLGIEKNRPLSDFISSLPGLAVWEVPKPRRDQIQSIAEELRRVKFQPPEGIEEYRFWAGSPFEASIDPFSERVDQGLIVSPFLSPGIGISDESVLAPFVHGNVESVLVSRHDVLRTIHPDALRRFKQVYFMDPELEANASETGESDGPVESLSGLHAKLYIANRGWKASVFSGSFNATQAAFSANVEFMVELIGSKERWGVDAFLNGKKDVPGFKNLLREFKPEETWSLPDQSEEMWERLVDEVRRGLVCARLYLQVEKQSESLYGLKLEIHSRSSLEAALQKACSIRIWPITLSEHRAIALNLEGVVRFEGISLEALTSMVVFEIGAATNGVTRKALFIQNLPLLGAPANRRDRILTSVLQDKEKLFQLILIILSAGEDGSLSSDLQKTLETDPNDPERRGFLASGMLEQLLEALASDSDCLRHVGDLIKDIQKSPERAHLLPDEFMHIWVPMAQAAKELRG